MGKENNVKQKKKKKGKKGKRERLQEGRQRQELSLDAATKVRLEPLRVFQGSGEVAADHKDTSKGIPVPWGRKSLDD